MIDRNLQGVARAEIDAVRQVAGAHDARRGRRCAVRFTRFEPEQEKRGVVAGMLRFDHIG